MSQGAVSSQTYRSYPWSPINDPRLKSRHSQFTDNPANDPDYIFRLSEKMRVNRRVRKEVHKCFKRGDLSFLMHDGQLKINHMLESNPKVSEYLILCSRQLGKSFSILIKAIEHCASYKGYRKPLVRVFCESETQVKDIIQDNMDVLEPLMPRGFMKRTKSEKRYHIGKGELRIGILSAAHVNGRRGGNATLIITEESGFSPSDDFKSAVQSVISPQLLRSRGKLIHVTTSSNDENHYIHQVVQPKCAARGALINLTIFDNPQVDDEQILEAYDKVEDGTGEGWKREYLCQIVRSVKLTVVPEFDDDMQKEIVRESKKPVFVNYLTSIDYGGVRDKHGILVMYYDFDRDKIVVSREDLLDINTATKFIISRTLELEELEVKDDIEIMRDQIGTRRVCDAPGQVRVDMNHTDYEKHDTDNRDRITDDFKGFSFYFPEKDEFSAGVQLLRKMIRIGKLEIHPRCKKTINQLKYGKLNKQRKDFERTEEFGHLDLIAALIYGIREIDQSNPYPPFWGRDQINKMTRKEKESNENFLIG